MNAKPILNGILLLISLVCGPAAHCDVKRFMAGNPADVNPELHGPALHIQGGGTDVDAAFQWMFDQVRGCTDCSTKLDVVVLSANSDGEYDEYLLAMKGVDSVETLVITSREDAASEEVVQTIRHAEVVFFEGGDQCNYVTYLKGTPVEAAVESVYERGGGIGGTSAGDAIQGEFLYDACHGSTQSYEALANPYHESTSFTGDFFHWKYLERTMTDQHLVERDRIGRTFAFLARLIRDGKTKSVLGVAADRETSVLLNKDGLATISGKGPAYFILADHAPEVCEPNKPLTYSNFKIWKVEAGGTFDLKNRPASGYYTRSVANGIIDNDPYSPEVCEAPAMVRKALEGSKEYDALMKQFPGDLFVRRAYLDSLDAPKAVEWTESLLKDHPGDPRLLYLSGRALLKANQAEKAVEAFRRALSAEPGFPLSHLELAAAYSRTDHSKVKEQVEDFIRSCPRNFAPYQYVENSDDTEFMRSKAQELRRFLNYTRGDELQAYATLWPLELKSAPEKDQAALREQIAQDTKELRLSGMEQSKALIADLRKIATPEGIETMEHVEIGGVRQWISIRGSNRKNPVLLVIHGGPGAPLMPLSWAFQKPWEDYFTVVQWDQRGAGKNYSYSDFKALTATTTIDRMVQDAEEMTAYLRSHLQQRKIVVLGFSWGTEIGTRLAKKRPEWLYAYVGVGQQVASGKVDSSLFAPAALAPEYYREDVDTLGEGAHWAAEQLRESIKNPDLNALGYEFKTSILLMASDSSSQYQAAKNYFDKINAPYKRFITLEGSSRFPMLEEPGRFLVTLVQEVLPLTRSVGTSNFSR